MSGKAAPLVRSKAGIYRRLSAVSPFWYLAGYLTLILAFAIADWRLGADRAVPHFYAPYARFEPSSLDDMHRLESAIRAAIIRNVASNRPEGDGWRIDTDSLDVHGLDAPQDDRMPFTVYLFAQHYTGGKINEGMGGPFPFTLDTKKVVIGSTNPIVCHLIKAPTPTVTGAPHEFDFNQLLTAPGTSLLPESLCWSPMEDGELARLLSGWKGNPNALSGFFPRMLYFSATTITTVGFGDIVPLSGLARLLTGLEAVSGWVLAGLFLNAVAWRAGQLAAAG